MYFYIYLLIFFVILIAGIIIYFILEHVNISNIKQQNEKINNKTKESLQKINFKTSKNFFLNDYATYNQPTSCKKYISIDIENKKICLIDYNKGKLLIVDFNEILNYEIYENGSQQTIGGNAGGLGAGLFGAETNGMCKELKLIIRLNKYDMSQINYNIIFNTTFNIGINKSTETYKQCINTLQEVVSFLEIVKNENLKK